VPPFLFLDLHCCDSADSNTCQAFLPGALVFGCLRTIRIFCVRCYGTPFLPVFWEWFCLRCDHICIYLPPIYRSIPTSTKFVLPLPRCYCALPVLGFCSLPVVRFYLLTTRCRYMPASGLQCHAPVISFYDLLILPPLPDYLPYTLFTGAGLPLPTMSHTWFRYCLGVLVRLLHRYTVLPHLTFFVTVHVSFRWISLPPAFCSLFWSILRLLTDLDTASSTGVWIPHCYVTPFSPFRFVTTPLIWCYLPPVLLPRQIFVSAAFLRNHPFRALPFWFCLSIFRCRYLRPATTVNHHRSTATLRSLLPPFITPGSTLDYRSGHTVTVHITLRLFYRLHSPLRFTVLPVLHCHAVLDFTVWIHFYLCCRFYGWPFIPIHSRYLHHTVCYVPTF